MCVSEDEHLLKSLFKKKKKKVTKRSQTLIHTNTPTHTYTPLLASVVDKMLGKLGVST